MPESSNELRAKGKYRANPHSRRQGHPGRFLLVRTDTGRTHVVVHDGLLCGSRWSAWREVDWAPRDYTMCARCKHALELMAIRVGLL